MSTKRCRLIAALALHYSAYKINRVSVRDATESASHERFYWSTIAKDVELVTSA